MSNNQDQKAFFPGEIIKKVTGKAVFGADIFFENMLFLKVLRAPYPHAKIKKIDKKEAEKSPGVKKVVTAKDISWVKNFGKMVKDQEVLVREKTRFMGDALAIVAAETEAQARQALELIKVDFEPLEVISDPFRAMSPGATQIHEKRFSYQNQYLNPGNILSIKRLFRGNVFEGFKEADFIVKNEFFTPHMEHCSLEPEAGVAFYDRRKGIYTIFAGTQSLHDTQREVAQALGTECKKVKIVQPEIGGAFGKREDISVHIFLGLMAFITKHPVKLVMTREETMISQSKRHPIRFRFKTGVKKDGMLTAWTGELVGDTGAYASTGQSVILKALNHFTGPYNVPHIFGVGYTVYTNNTYGGSMRGFGATQAAFAYESHMDSIADKLGMDPVELRLKNSYEIGSITPTGQILGKGVRVKETLNQAVKTFGYKPGNLKKDFGDKIRGVGVASSMFACGYGLGLQDGAKICIEVGDNGCIFVYSAAADVGQGFYHVIREIVSKTMNIPQKFIKIQKGDTHNTENSGSTSASRQTIFSGNAAKKAAEELLRKIEILASDFIQSNGNFFEVIDDKIYLVGKERKISLSSLFQIAAEKKAPLKAIGVFSPKTDTPDFETGQGKFLYIGYSFNTHIVEVEIDKLTGETQVKKIVSAPDVGKAINKQAVEGQSEGGIAMGIGMALMEKQVFERSLTKNPDFSSYLIPTVFDIPEKVVTTMVEYKDGPGPFGSKGFGEPALLPAAPAVINAISNAVGVRFCKTPVTSGDILIALKKGETTN